MAKLNDRQKKFIIAEHIEGTSIRALAKKYKVSATTIQRVIHSDTDYAQKVADKKEANAQEVIAHMDAQKETVCTLIDRLLEEMGSSDKMKDSSLVQLATTMGILIDKFTVNENVQFSNSDTHLDITITAPGSKDAEE